MGMIASERQAGPSGAEDQEAVVPLLASEFSNQGGPSGRRLSHGSLVVYTNLTPGRSPPS